MFQFGPDLQDLVGLQEWSYLIHGEKQFALGLLHVKTWAALMWSFDLKRDLWLTGNLNWVWG